eukprot:403372756
MIKIAFYAILSIQTLQALRSTGKSRNSLDFILIGDFGNFQTQTGLSEQNFDIIDWYAANMKETVEGVILLGDSMYAQNKFYPTEQEQQALIDLFKTRPTLSQIPIHHIRGNHDMEYTYDNYLKYSTMHSNWLLRYKFYVEYFDLPSISGTHLDKKAQFLFIDTNIMYCAYDFTFHWNCTQDDVNEAEFQKQWLIYQLRLHQNDHNVVWRVVVAHQPIFQKQELDDVTTLNLLLPILLEHKVDMYLSGHEHMQYHAFYPHSKVNNSESRYYVDEFDNVTLYRNRKQHKANFDWKNTTLIQQRQQKEQAATNSQSQNNQIPKLDYLQFNKSEGNLHQIVDGSGGKDMHSSNINQPSRACYSYMQNQYFGFSHLQLTAEEIQVTFMSSEYGHSLFSLYPNMNPEKMLIADPKVQMTVKIINDMQK